MERYLREKFAKRKAIEHAEKLERELANERNQSVAWEDSSPASQIPPDCQLSDLPEVQSQQSVAVLDFQASGDQMQGVGESLADLCRDAVLESGRFVLIERESIKAILDEEDFADTFKCDDTKCLVNFGKKLRAQKIIHGRVNEIGKSSLITIKILDVSSTKVEGLKTAKVSGLEQALDFVQPVTCEILRKSLTAER